MSFAREHLLQIYQAAVRAVNGESCVQKVLATHDFAEHVAVVAIGKAASSMMLGAASSLGSALCAGLVITKEGHCDDQLCRLKNIRCVESAHPIPDQRSLDAGQALLSFMAEQPDHRDFVFLISGGASSLVEVLPVGLGLVDLQRINDWLLANGCDIAEINRVRKSFSCIKGGRLAQYLEGRVATCLMISDVPDNHPSVIGSGFLSPQIPGASLSFEMPEWVKMLPKAPPMPAANHPCFATIETELIATLDDAMQAAAKTAEQLGYEVSLHQNLLTCDAQLAGQQLAREVLGNSPALHIWGGETTVQLPANPGHGGRSQQLALAAAIELAGNDDVYFLAAGTDGSDGPTNAAGALIDTKTFLRGERAGFDARHALSAANANAFLQASGDLLHTGPTGTNVMDLVLAVKLSVS